MEGPEGENKTKEKKQTQQTSPLTIKQRSYFSPATPRDNNNNNNNDNNNDDDDDDHDDDDDDDNDDDTIYISIYGTHPSLCAR